MYGTKTADPIALVHKHYISYQPRPRPNSTSNWQHQHPALLPARNRSLMSQIPLFLRVPNTWRSPACFYINGFYTVITLSPLINA